MSCASESSISANRVVYIGGLAEEVTTDVLRKALLPFGELVEVQLPIDYQSQKHRGFPFAEFELTEDAAATVVNLRLRWRSHKANLAKSNLQRRPNEQSSRPVWADDEWLQKYAAGSKESPVIGSQEHGSSFQIDNQEISHHITSQPLQRVYFEIHIDNIPCGRSTFELFADAVPITVKNFQALCVGFKLAGRTLCYKSCTFHRINPDFTTVIIVVQI